MAAGTTITPVALGLILEAVWGGKDLGVTLGFELDLEVFALPWEDLEVGTTVEVAWRCLV